MIARTHHVDFRAIRQWSVNEGASGLYKEFRREKGRHRREA
jgi:hypothetical protein